jgi:hypothetical protein
MHIAGSESEINDILDLSRKCNGFDIPANETLDRERRHEYDEGWVAGYKMKLKPYIPGFVRRLVAKR